MADVVETRAAHSRMRLAELRYRLANAAEVQTYPSLTVFSAGSYARLEASEYSDIDLFFFSDADRDAVPEPHTCSLRLFGRVIQIADDMRFPRFSNDCRYLEVLHADDIITALGGPMDDYLNHFTARMLLLLESQPIYGDDIYWNVIGKIITSYFRDFPDHPWSFLPTFLLNDIGRFWKTLLLNYENKRQFASDKPDFELRRTKQKVRNFKLKYSRMTTCFASVAALGTYRAPVTERDVVDMVRLTPQERLAFVADRVPGAKTAATEVLRRYAAFLELTGMPTPELESRFSDKERRTDMFKTADEYGGAMYELIQAVDAAGEHPSLLRHLVI